jgi:adenine-specific DNA-methyltransferase
VRFEYASAGVVITPLRELAGQSGWLECARLAVDSLEREEFLLFAATTDAGSRIPSEVCARFFDLPATVEGTTTDTGRPFEDELTSEAGARLREIDGRNSRHFDEEVVKLDHWSEDLKQGLERQIKDLDRQIREARRRTMQGVTLNEKLEIQKQVKSLEAERTRHRRHLFEAQDEIDGRRETLIADIEKQLAKRSVRSPVFRIRWKVVKA